MLGESSLVKAGTKNHLVVHRRFDLAYSAVKNVFYRTQIESPQILPIVGPTRVGKSTLLEDIVKNLALTETGETAKSILYIRCQQLPNVRALADMSLRGIGLNPSLFKNADAATDAFIQSVIRRGHLLIIYDEAQEMLERAKVSSRGIGDFFKKVHDQSKSSLILAGLPTLLDVFRANEQLRARSMAPIKFYPYWHSSKGFVHFWEALAGALQHLKQSQWDTLEYDDVDFARRTYVATQGCFGLVTKLFEDVEVTNFESKQAKLQEFRAAYEKSMHNCGGNPNPFDPKTTITDELMASAYNDALRESGAQFEVLSDDNPTV